MVCENCLHRTVCEYSYTMTERYGCIYHSRKENIIIPELEKIKAEIEEHGNKANVNKNEYELAISQTCDYISIIIDNHIKELKGE